MDILNSLPFLGTIISIFSRIGEFFLRKPGPTYNIGRDMIVITVTDSKDGIAIYDSASSSSSLVPQDQFKISMNVAKFAQVMIDNSPEVVEALVAQYTDPVIVGVYAVKHALSNPAIVAQMSEVIESDRRKSDKLSDALDYVRDRLEKIGRKPE